jgi:integrase
MGKQKPYVATTEQVWALHDAMPEHLRVAIPLGAFVGLRIAEVSGLRVVDVDFIRGVVNPVQQWPSDLMVTNGCNGDGAGPWLIERAVRQAKVAIAESENDFETRCSPCPSGSRSTTYATTWRRCLSRRGRTSRQFRPGCGMRRRAPRWTPTHHLWPDADESTRSAIDSVIAKRVDSVQATADGLRTDAAPRRNRRR